MHNDGQNELSPRGPAPLRTAELCAGYGGIAMGLKSLFGDNTNLVMVAETDKWASKVLAHHHPHIPNIGDVTDGDWVDHYRGKVDLIAAGTPCQDISVAGKGMSLQGQRSAILLDVLDAVAHIRPSHFVWENVHAATYRKGALPGETVLETVERRLRRAGYRVASGVFSAAQVGAPHLRRRVFVLASLPGASLQGASLPGASHNPWPALPTPTVVDMGNNKTREEWNAWADRMRSKHNNGNGHGKSLSQEVRYNFEGYRHAAQYWDDVLTDIEPVFVNLGQSLPTPTRSMSTGPRDSGREGGWNLQTAIHELGMPNTQDDDGRMSVEFVEWMMGLPRGWVTGVPGVSRTQQLKMLGNGVVPLQAAFAIDSLRQILDSREESYESCF